MGSYTVLVIWQADQHTEQRWSWKVINQKRAKSKQKAVWLACQQGLLSIMTTFQRKAATGPVYLTFQSSLLTPPLHSAPSSRQ